MSLSPTLQMTGGATIRHYDQIKRNWYVSAQPTTTQSTSKARANNTSENWYHGNTANKQARVQSTCESVYSQHAMLLERGP